MLALMAAGSVFFPGLFLLSKQSLKHIMGWSDGDAAIVSTRFVSSLQAVLASSAGLVISSSCSDVLQDRHWLTDTYILFAAPYFAFDIYAMFLCYLHKLQVKGHEGQEGGVGWKRAAVAGYLRREKLLVLHHVFMVAFCCPASLVLWRKGSGDFFQGSLFLAELSTPFVCLSKVLIQKEHTLLHRVNGLLLLLTFFFCRVLLFPYLYFSYSRSSSVPLYRVPLVAPWQCILGASLLWPLQLYWFTLICRGALRATGGRSHRTPPPPE
uniref:TLC domain containing 3B n=1 Tax=Cyclopterus lumpus TaxID=8103 RepID=A0A8C2WGU5_CYCLU